MKLPTWLRGVSARLLVLTIFFVMVSEVLIYVPSIARFRLTFLEQRLEMAHLGSLALKATPNLAVAPDLEQELLDNADVFMTAIKSRDSRSLMLGADMPPGVEVTYDLRDASAMELILAAFEALLHGDRVLRIIGHHPDQADGSVEIIVSERPLYEAMLVYSTNILQLSIVISLITAGLVYIALQYLLVRPMRRVTGSITAFGKSPESAHSMIAESDRSDEIGMAQRELAQMQHELRTALQQKSRLAALGGAIAKINHDLRNILATGQLLSDRLAKSQDPNVKRITPVLMGTIDRAIELCNNTLNYGRAEEAKPVLERFPLASLVDDVAHSVGLPDDGRIRWDNQVAAQFQVIADRRQLFRVLLNLGRNAVQAMASGGAVTIEAEENAAGAIIRLSDTGSGLAPKARANLFKPFEGSARDGGTGLGLAIAQELVGGHGGSLTLVRSDAAGTVFEITLPRPAEN